VVYDASVIHDRPPLAAGVRALGVPCTAIARELGLPRAKNVVALGALQAATGLFPAETLLAAIRQSLGSKDGKLAANEAAFTRGAAAASGGLARA
jgi:2-oxoisovalerate ferredoxin oxidoreductase beta subunit